MDKWLFRRNMEAIPLVNDKPIGYFDPDFSTVGSYRFAKFKAFERLKKLLERELLQEQHPNKLLDRPIMKWTGQKVQLVELIYALKVAGVFNNGQAELKEMASNFEKLFGIEVGDIYRIFQEIRLRKKGRTTFLDGLKNKLEGYMEEAEGMG